MRLGIFGGTFDPVHYGHLRTAEVCRETLELDRVLFVPNRVSPYKTEGKTVTPGELRAEMLRLAVYDNPHFAVSTIEINRPGPSYTVDTLRELRQTNPHDELFFLTGSDAIRGLPGWHEPEALLDLAHFVALTRPGVLQADVLAALPDAWERRILFIAAPGLDISATDLRQRANRKQSLRYLTPPAVAAFIEARGLYDTTNETTLQSVK